MTGQMFGQQMPEFFRRIGNTMDGIHAGRRSLPP